MGGISAFLQILSVIALVVGIGNVLPIADNSEPVVGVVLIIAAVVLWKVGKRIHIQAIKATIAKVERGEELDDNDVENRRFINGS